ncbi:hypothetical protein [Vulgatibacter sp.]|uniref:hypothetical protein n=1 Tax=Vulgatibacter sp. TaxID=1971226 RepID=UPI0035652622
MKRLLLPGLLVLVAACGVESGTGEEAVPFTLVIAADPAGQSFTTRAGWQVELEEAHLAVGPLALFTNAAPTASFWQRVRGLVMPVAHAHAGFDEYDGGAVRGELLEPVAIDLLDTGGRRFELTGIAGPVRSASLELQPVEDAALRGAQAWVRGTATRGAEVVRFEGGLVLPADRKSRRVSGIPAQLVLGEGSEVLLEVHPQRWFDDADFGSLPEAEEDGVRGIDPAGQVHAAWRLGARAYGAFTVQ